MKTKMTLYCCGCQRDVNANLTNGLDIYPHRKDLHTLPFWKCEVCFNYVGCHYKTDEPTKPLGVIPTASLRSARKFIHQSIDPLWKSKKYKRSEVYAFLSQILGRAYHTADLRSEDECMRILSSVREKFGGIIP